MKKVLLFLLMFTVLLCGCKKHKLTTTELNVENVTNTDKQYMFTNYGGDYRWFETCILLKNYLDEENDGSIAGISNVFQVVENKDEKSADVFVIFAAHTPDTTSYEVKQGFWVEDSPLNEEEIKLTYKQAYEKIMQVNLPKPHSKNCILRKPIGPVECNPQYVFGNVQKQIWVDAVTGDICESNPAFPDELKMPLGEWP